MLGSAWALGEHKRKCNIVRSLVVFKMVAPAACLHHGNVQKFMMPFQARKGCFKAAVGPRTTVSLAGLAGLGRLGLTAVGIVGVSVFLRRKTDDVPQKLDAAQMACHLPLMAGSAPRRIASRFQARVWFVAPVSGFNANLKGM